VKKVSSQRADKIKKKNANSWASHILKLLFPNSHWLYYTTVFD